MLALKGKKMKKVENILNWNGIEKKSKIYLGIGGIYKKKIFWFTNVDQTQVYVDWINWID